MKGRAREGAVRLLDNDDVDRTSEGRGVYLVVEETEVADDLGDIVHTVHVQARALQVAENDRRD